jgi:cathepsin L
MANRTVLFAFLLSIAVAHGAAVEVEMYEDYRLEQYVEEFGKEYATEAEALEREVTFMNNLKKIRTQNEAYAQGTSTWFAAVNKHVDRTAAEMKMLRGYNRDVAQAQRMLDIPSRNLMTDYSTEDLPTDVDWRTKGVVTPPKNQGGCGSCWSFSATESVESAVAIATGKLLTLAPQEFVSCLKNPNQCGGTGGCEGATAELAFGYAAKNGLALESSYPYQGSDSSCSSSKATPAAWVTNYTKLPMNDADALAAAVATKGPISISVAAGSWSFYGGGIFDGMGGKCDVDIDHAVQLVGYGLDTSVGTNGTHYWLVRNSWGSWGEKGYIRLKRNPGNEPCAIDKTPLDGVCGKSGDCKCAKTVKYCGTCGVLSDSSYPTGAKLATPSFLRK